MARDRSASLPTLLRSTFPPKLPVPSAGSRPISGARAGHSGAAPKGFYGARPSSRGSSRGDVKGDMYGSMPLPLSRQLNAHEQTQFPVVLRRGTEDEGLGDPGGLDDGRGIPCESSRYTKTLQRLQLPMVRRSVKRLVNEIQWTHSTEKDMFDKLDLNGDGVLSKPEVSKGLRKMGVTLLPVELDAVLRAFDEDNNGSIDFEEFYTVLETMARTLVEQKTQEQKVLIHGFEQGARVRSLIRFPIAKEAQSLGSDVAERNPFAIVLGYGVKDGTVLIKLESSKETWSVRPAQLVTLETHSAHARNLSAGRSRGFSSEDSDNSPHSPKIPAGKQGSRRCSFGDVACKAQEERRRERARYEMSIQERHRRASY